MADYDETFGADTGTLAQIDVGHSQLQAAAPGGEPGALVSDSGPTDPGVIAVPSVARINVPLGQQLSPAASVSPGESIIGEGMNFEGTAVVSSSARIQGVFQGSLSVSGTNSLAIESKGTLQGDAEAHLVTIAGKFEGEMKVHQVILEETSVTSGTIQYQKISMAGGDHNTNLKRVPA